MPANRCAAKRLRQRPTIVRSIASCAEMALLVSPSAASSTIRARDTVRAGAVRLRDQVSNVCRSASLKLITTAFCIGLILLQKMRHRKPIMGALIMWHYTRLNDDQGRASFSEYKQRFVKIRDTLRSAGVGVRSHLLEAKDCQLARASDSLTACGSTQAIVQALRLGGFPTR